MRWKQFLTPVKAIDANSAREKIDKTGSDELTILDVRQPGEYERGHIPGAKLIPVGDLNERVAELDADKETIVYCAIGGRSRVAAQMLAGKGFKEVINLTGGIKAWHSQQAYGPEDEGLELFTGRETLADILIIAYGLEKGLEDFYGSMADMVKSQATRQTLLKLKVIEEKHQKKIFQTYRQQAADEVTRDKFEQTIVSGHLEGGLTTAEYLSRFKPDLESEQEVISLAISIEAQALDLYSRAAAQTDSSQSRDFLLGIAAEEKAHIALLGDLMETLVKQEV